MAKWINTAVIQDGVKTMSGITHVVLCSGFPHSIGDVFISTASNYLLSIQLAPAGRATQSGASILVSALSTMGPGDTTISYASTTVSFAQTSAFSADFAGTATHVAWVSGTLASRILYVTTCTAQGVAINVPYYVNATTLNINSQPT